MQAGQHRCTVPLSFNLCYFKQHQDETRPSAFQTKVMSVKKHKHRKKFTKETTSLVQSQTSQNVKVKSKRRGLHICWVSIKMCQVLTVYSEIQQKKMCACGLLYHLFLLSGAESGGCCNTSAVFFFFNNLIHFICLHCSYFSFYRIFSNSLQHKIVIATMSDLVVSNFQCFLWVVLWENQKTAIISIVIASNFPLVQPNDCKASPLFPLSLSGGCLLQKYANC